MNKQKKGFWWFFQDYQLCPSQGRERLEWCQSEDGNSQVTHPSRVWHLSSAWDEFTAMLQNSKLSLDIPAVIKSSHFYSTLCFPSKCELGPNKLWFCALRMGYDNSNSFSQGQNPIPTEGQRQKLLGTNCMKTLDFYSDLQVREWMSA